MTADIIELPTARPKRTQVVHAIHSGESANKQLENLHAEGRLPVSTLIVDASKAKFQKEFITDVKENGGDVILDTRWRRTKRGWSLQWPRKESAMGASW